MFTLMQSIAAGDQYLDVLDASWDMACKAMFAAAALGYKMVVQPAHATGARS